MKYLVLRDMTYNGRRYAAGSAISKEAILEVNESKLGTLLRTRFIGEPPTRILPDMGMGELRDHARDLGVEGPLPRSKTDLISLIEGAKHEDPE